MICDLQVIRDPELTDCLDDYFSADQNPGAEIMRKCDKCNKVCNLQTWVIKDND
jgi:hypothetical protein